MVYLITAQPGFVTKVMDNAYNQHGRSEWPALLLGRNCVLLDTWNTHVVDSGCPQSSTEGLLALADV